MTGTYQVTIQTYESIITYYALEAEVVQSIRAQLRLGAKFSLSVLGRTNHFDLRDICSIDVKPPLSYRRAA